MKVGTEVVAYMLIITEVTELTIKAGSEVVTEMHIKAGTEVVTEMHIKALEFCCNRNAY